ncbi:MAG: hypothetical protein Q9187_000646 [Circinaria calcarea]
MRCDRKAALACLNALEVPDLDIVDFNGPLDPEIALNWKPRKKWLLIASLAAMTLITSLASSMFAPGVPRLMTEFGSTSPALASFVVSVYVLGNAAGPMVIAPLSELYGRSPLYNSTNALFVVFTVACAVSSSLDMLIGFRLLQGIAGSAVIALGGGTISDLFVQEERGKAIAIWSICPLLGPIIGPVMGGFLSAAEGWRWVFWVLAMASSTITVIYPFTVRETYSVALLEHKTARLRKQLNKPSLRSKLASNLSWRNALQHAIIRPFKMLLFSPIISLLATLSAIVYGYLYLLFTTLTTVFEVGYGFSPSLVGLTFLGVGIGMIIGVTAFGLISDRRLKRAKANQEEMKPEYRLTIMIPGGFCIPVGLFIYGWTAEKHVFWLVPILGTSFVGVGIMTFFAAIQAYLVDAFTQHAASALAANAIWRAIVGALIPLAGLPMYDKLGLGWGNSLLGFIAVALIPVPFLLVRYGERIRKHKRFRID